MQGGDLDNSTPPRALIVFEGLVGYIEEDQAARHRHSRRRRRWHAAAACWEISRAAVDWIWEMKCPLTLITYMDAGEAAALELRFEEEAMHMPFGTFEVTTLEDVARRVGWDKSILAVYDGNVEHWLTYGAKGRIFSLQPPSLEP